MEWHKKEIKTKKKKEKENQKHINNCYSTNWLPLVKMANIPNLNAFTRNARPNESFFLMIYSKSVNFLELKWYAEICILSIFVQKKKKSREKKIGNFKCSIMSEWHEMFNWWMTWSAKLFRTKHQMDNIQWHV